MSEVTPRITQSYLEQFTNKTVRLVGKVTQLRGDTATLDAGGAITVALNRESHLQNGHAYEVVGKVMNDLSVRVLMSTDLGVGVVDFAAADAVVDANHRYKEIFYAAA